MTNGVIDLASRRATAPDIVAGLRSLADEIEAKGADAPVTTCVVLLGHTWVEGDQPNASLGKYVFGPRTDPFTVQGLESLALSQP